VYDAHDPQDVRFQAWFNDVYAVSKREWDSLVPGTIVYGELMFVCHKASYNKLPDWFLVFDVWNTKQYTPWSDTAALCSLLGLCTVPVISVGNFELHNLYGKIPYSSGYGKYPAEGIVVKNYARQLMGKIVKPSFTKNRCGSTSSNLEYNEVVK
jgi:hypothetical protein